MEKQQNSQAWKGQGWSKRSGPGSDLITPNPKLKLLDHASVSPHYLHKGKTF
jgi:hypothetical protein